MSSKRCSAKYKCVEQVSQPTKWLTENEDFYDKTISYLYENLNHPVKKSLPISTLTNVIRQSHSAMNNLCNSIIYWRLEKGTLQNSSETLKVESEIENRLDVN